MLHNSTVNSTALSMFSPVLGYGILYHIVLCCTVLQGTVSCCTVPHLGTPPGDTATPRMMPVVAWSRCELQAPKLTSSRGPPPLRNDGAWTTKTTKRDGHASALPTKPALESPTHTRASNTAMTRAGCARQRSTTAWLQQEVPHQSSWTDSGGRPQDGRRFCQRCAMCICPVRLHQSPPTPIQPRTLRRREPRRQLPRRGES